MRLGATAISRDRFLDELKESQMEPDDLGSWQHFKWEYNDDT